MKICYAFLNYHRSPAANLSFISRLPENDVVFATSDPTLIRTVLPTAKNIIDVKGTSIATCKNRLLKEFGHAKKYDYMFIIEDDAVINDFTIFTDYIKLMKQFNLGYINYGCGHETNTIFGVHNPALILTGTKNSESYIFNRLPYAMITGYDLNINNLYYDESYKMIETKEYMIRLVEAKLIPFLGFYLDINDADIRVSHLDNLRKRPTDIQQLMKEQSILADSGKKYTAEDKIEKVLEWVVGKV